MPHRRILFTLIVTCALTSSFVVTSSFIVIVAVVM